MTMNALLWQVPEWAHRLVQRHTGWHLIRKGKAKFTYTWIKK